MTSDFISYNELAWTEEYLVAPDNYKIEVTLYNKLIHESSDIPIHTMLHLGCGAGGHDNFLKNILQ